MLALRPNGPVRLNPLDAGPALSVGSDDVRGRRIGVVVALAESAVGRAVSSDERSVVTAALMELERRSGRATPTLRHVMDLLMGPTETMATELSSNVHELAADAKSVARGLHRLVEGDLAGMFDGASTTTVDWSGPGIAIDLSAVLQSPAFSAILVCAGAWLAQAVAAKDRQRIIVVDECWKAIRDAGFVAWGEETQKLSRCLRRAIRHHRPAHLRSCVPGRRRDDHLQAGPGLRHRGRDEGDVQPGWWRGPRVS